MKVCGRICFIFFFIVFVSLYSSPTNIDKAFIWLPMHLNEHVGGGAADRISFIQNQLPGSITFLLDHPDVPTSPNLHRVYHPVIDFTVIGTGGTRSSNEVLFNDTVNGDRDRGITTVDGSAHDEFWAAGTYGQIEIFAVVSAGHTYSAAKEDSKFFSLSTHFSNDQHNLGFGFLGGSVGVVIEEDGGTRYSVWSNQPLGIDTWALYYCLIDFVNGNCEVSVNNTNYIKFSFSDVGGDGKYTFNTGIDLRAIIGGSGVAVDATDKSWYGKVAEIQIFTNGLNLAEKESAYNFLADEYGFNTINITAVQWTSGYPVDGSLYGDWRDAYNKNVSIQLEDDGKVFYVVVTNNAAAPNDIQITNGVNYGTEIVVNSGNFIISGNTITNIEISGLSGLTDYEMYLITFSTNNNVLSPDIKTFSFTTSVEDSTAPAFIGGTPFTNLILSSLIGVDVSIDEDGKIYAIVVTNGSQPPDAVNVFNMTNYGGVTIISSNMLSVSSGDTSNIIFNNLSPSTDYDIYFIAIDFTLLSNMSSVMTVTNVTTPAVDLTPPSYTTEPVMVNIGEYTAVLSGAVNEYTFLYYVVLTNGAAEPLSNDIMNGTGLGGEGVVTNGSFSTLSGAFSNNVTFNADYTSYDIWVAAHDFSSNFITNVLTECTTLSNTPPAAGLISIGSGLGVISAAQFSAVVEMNATEACTLYYVVQPTNIIFMPNLTQVKTGLDGTGAAAAASGVFSLNGNVIESGVISGLQDNTSYHIYFTLFDGYKDGDLGVMGPKTLTTATDTKIPKLTAEITGVTNITFTASDDGAVIALVIRTNMDSLSDFQTNWYLPGAALTNITTNFALPFQLEAFVLDHKSNKSDLLTLVRFDNISDYNSYLSGTEVTSLLTAVPLFAAQLYSPEQIQNMTSSEEGGVVRITSFEQALPVLVDIKTLAAGKRVEIGDIDLYDVNGKKICGISSEHVFLNGHLVLWDKKTDNGPVAPGVYIVSLMYKSEDRYKRFTRIVVFK
jgi:hypothetical protein